MVWESGHSENQTASRDRMALLVPHERIVTATAPAGKDRSGQDL